jgi:hypothetical protein
VWIFVLAHFLGWTRPSEAGGSEKEELVELEEKIDAARAFLLQMDTVAQSLDESIQALEEKVVFTPTTSDRYAWAYEYVSRCASQSGIELDSVEEVLFLEDEEDAKNRPALEPYEIKVSTYCGYNRLVEFIWRLEGGNPLLRIKEVRISANDRPDQQRVEVRMQWPASVTIAGEKTKENGADGTENATTSPSER